MPEVQYKFSQTTIDTNNRGIDELLQFYHFAKAQPPYTKITLNLSNLTKFDANLSAVLLAINHRIKRQKKYLFVEIPGHINVLFRNGFVGHMQGKGDDPAIFDNRDSTIPLKTFMKSEDESFCSYLKKDFFGQRGLDDVPAQHKTALRSHFEEIFTNVGLHAETEELVYTCGQFFPVEKVLKFSLLDLGVGFLKKIQPVSNGKVTCDREAIDWATFGGNSTKDKKLHGPGGSGLKDIRDYCSQNSGSLHIVSGTCYWTIVNGKLFSYVLSRPFEGVMVNLIFRNI